MEYLSTEKILLVDLAAGQTEEIELETDLVEEKIGGAAICKHLYEEYADDDPIVVGTGLLTGTLCPASSAGIITAKSPRTGKLAHCAITYKVGVEIKYSGFDFVVVRGAAAGPVYLWVHDGVADIVAADEIWGKDVWESTDALRKKVGDDLLQTIMIGPAGEAGSDFAQVCYNHWNSPDRFGFGKCFGAKNLKGFAFRGMGLLEAADPEGFVERSLEMLEDIKEEGLPAKKGIGELAAELGDADLASWLAPVVHRSSADYFTPCATNTFLFLDEDPALIKETKVPEPGVLVADVQAVLALKAAGLDASGAGQVLKACAKQGIDPEAVATLGAGTGKIDSAAMIAGIDGLSGDVPIAGAGVFSPWAPVRPFFGKFDLEEDDTAIMAWWERRQAVASIFGIQPLFILMSPNLSDENMLALANIGAELDLTQEKLDAVVSELLN
jgi:aldehyde:ferredoxin oxidoreductase